MSAHALPEALRLVASRESSAGRGDAIVNLLPLPLVVVDATGRVVEANAAAEAFFEVGRVALCRSRLADLLPFGSPVLGLVDQVREAGGSLNEYRVDIGNPRIGMDRVVDVFLAPASDSSGEVVLMLQE